jgi:uncharacterized membrane protein YgdD (TMEM256/DUF423 family)
MRFPRYKIWLVLGALFGGLAVALGAFGAHGLEKRLAANVSLSEAERTRLTAVWDTAAQYQMYHALALLAVGLLAARRCGVAVHLAGTAFTAGTLIFSGCLYAFVLTTVRVLGAAVPVGGSLLIVGWVALLIAAFQMPVTDDQPPDN